MKNVKRITKGTMIDTPVGYMIATGFNGSLVYFDVFEPEMIEDKRGNFVDVPGSGMVKVEECRLTLNETAGVMKEVDGRNHKVVWQEPGFIVRDREAGNIIDRFDTEEEALAALAEYEDEDRADGTYTEEFYEVVEEGNE